MCRTCETRCGCTIMGCHHKYRAPTCNCSCHLEIEVGKRYRSKDGREHLIWGRQPRRGRFQYIVADDNSIDAPRYDKYGRSNYEVPGMDLVEEVESKCENNTPLKIKAGKVYNTRGGESVRILCTDAPGGEQPVVGVDTLNGAVYKYELDGSFYSYEARSYCDLVSEYKEPKYAWFNVYENSMGDLIMSGRPHKTKQAADLYTARRVSRIKVKLEEGRWDE